MGKKYTSDEELQEAVKNSYSMSEAIRYLGKNPQGSTHRHYSKRVESMGISTDHFPARSPLQGYHGGGLSVKKSALEILINDQTLKKRLRVYQVRRAIIESGVVERCVFCGLESSWNGKSIVLHIDHIDGDWRNNLLSNLRFLCPNCHSQTETFGVKNL